MAENGHQSITLLGRDWPITLPDFAARDELAAAWSESASTGQARILRVCAAVLGLLTPLGREAKADYLRARCDPYAYGGAVYSWLRAQGVTPGDIAAATTGPMSILAESLFPRESEVSASASFFDAAAEPMPPP